MSLDAVLTLANRLCLSKVHALVREQWFLSLDRIDPRARVLGEAVMQLALDDGLLKRSGNRFVPTAKLAQPAPYGELLVQHADIVALDPIAFRWLTRALDALPSVLLGAILAEEALFPRSDFSLVSDLYAKSPLFSFFSNTALDVLAKLPSARVLEVGGGTAGVARELLARQPGVSLVFTDVSPLLVERAQASGLDAKRFDARVLDLNELRWNMEGGFGAVVALNVLHLVKEPEQVLARLSAQLAPGGVLILGEVSPPTGSKRFPLMELTFGQLPSFRAGGSSPLRSPEAWQRALFAAGFARTNFIPLATADGEGAPNLGGVHLAYVGATS